MANFESHRKPSAISHTLSPVYPARPDAALIIAASWEERCLGLPRRLADYRADLGLVPVYDGKSTKRANHIEELDAHLTPRCNVHHMSALHSYPIPNVRETIRLLGNAKQKSPGGITIDISTFTR